MQACSDCQAAQPSSDWGSRRIPIVKQHDLQTARLGRERHPHHSRPKTTALLLTSGAAVRPKPSPNSSTAPRKRRGCPTETVPNSNHAPRKQCGSPTGGVPCRPDAQPRYGKHLPDGIARPIHPLSDRTQNTPAPENGSGVFPHPYIFSARGLQKGNHASRAFRRPVSGRFFCFPSPRPLFAVHRSAGFKSFPSGRAARAPRRGFRPPPRS